MDFRLGDWRTALADVDSVDTVIVDAPYSAKCHSGHDSAPTVGTLASYERDTHGSHRSGLTKHNGWKRPGRNAIDLPYERRAIGYDVWTPADVSEFVDHWSPRCSGWFVTITDHVLAPAWDAALAKCGRYVFAPMPWYASGSRVRLSGDGPSSWTCWIVVARPSTGTFGDGTPCNRWGTLPGGYAIPQDRGNTVVGGKPKALMRALVRDYSRPGSLVCDPCAGGGTTLRAAVAEGRRAVGAEIDPETWRKGSGLQSHGPDEQQDLFTQATP